MKRKFCTEVQGVNTAVGMLAVGMLLMSVPIINSGSFAKLLVATLIIVVILGLVWFAIARGTYILIDSSQGILRISRFFMSTTLLLRDITNVSSVATFGGVITAVRITGRDKGGKLKKINTMSLQAFRKNEFKEFVDTLRTVNSNIEIPQDIFSK